MEQNEFELKEIQNTNPSAVNTAMKYGLMAGVSLILITVLFYVLNYMPKGAVNMFPYLIIGGFIIYGCIEYRENECGGFLSYGSAVKTGVLIALFASIIMAAYTYIFYQFIDPAYVNVILNAQEEALVEKNLSQEMIDVQMDMVKKFMTPMYLALFTVFGFVIFGLIISLITSIFVRKEKPFFDPNR